MFTTEDTEGTEEYIFTMKDLARHSRNQKIHLNHEPHEKHEKIKDTKMLSTDDADKKHEDLTGMDRIDRIRILLHHEVHEDA